MAKLKSIIEAVAGNGYGADCKSVDDAGSSPVCLSNQYAFDVMLKALQEVRKDPKHKKLSSKSQEAMHEALAAAE